jgi:hypothetical protein
LFDNRARVGHELEDGARFLLVMMHSRPDKDAFGAQSAGRDARHGGTNSELSRFIAGRAHYSPLGGRRANNHWLSAEGGIIPLLDRGVERIHVEMKDDAKHDMSKPATALLNPEASMFAEPKLLRFRSEHN